MNAFNASLSIAKAIVILALISFFSIAQAQSSLFDRFGDSNEQPSQELLSAEQAFQVVDTIVQGNELLVLWQSATGYYFYRDKFRVESVSPEIQIGQIKLPQGIIEKDPLFGDVEVYFDPVEMRVPLSFSGSNGQASGEYQFILHSQGCNKPIGVCYPPQKTTITVNLADISPISGQNQSNEIESGIKASDIEKQSTTVAQQSVEIESDSSLLWNILIAFGVGILLVFTPCVLPMIPILSGLVVGQQQTSKSKALFLSLAYILGTAVTYSSMGIAAGAAGIHLQAYFQHPAIIASMVALLIFLASSMFGLVELRMPSRFQNMVANKTSSVSKGSFFMTMIVGMLSALIVSTCVSPLLILVLGAAMREGSPLIGGVMMFFMAIGMGVPLMLFALGAQWLLPKAGSWMTHVKEFFGFAVLATAILVASSLKTVPGLLLWAILFIVFGIWLWRSASNFQAPLLKLFKIIALFVLFWGGASGLGAFYGGDQLFNPLERVINAGKPQIQLPFQTIKSAEEFELALSEAKKLNQPVLVDYYADWCTYCIVMEKTTYREKAVADSLDGWRLLKLDVTIPNENSQSIKNRFKIIAPPATLFIDRNGQELTALRRYGLIKANEFIKLIDEVE